MSILVFTETENGSFKKSAFEVVSYAHDLAQKIGSTVTAISFGAENASELGTYGANKVLNVVSDNFNTFNAEAYAQAIVSAAENENASVLIFGASNNAKYLAPLTSGKLKAGYVPNVVSAPISVNPFVVKRSAFSNKSFAHTTISTNTKVIGVSNNSFGIFENKVSATVENFEPNVQEAFKVKQTQVDKVSGKVTISDADTVVSGGRGLKGPENWGMIEELAEILGAATACSKPVSDMGWRPHSEHVGQTGKPVASNLYIAIGISGAIQHLAGVNAAKTKVVINNDPEAPFFKAADYGVVGDAFEVVPKLIEKLKEFKAQNS